MKEGTLVKYKKVIWIILLIVVLILLLDQYQKHEVEIKVFLRFNEKNIIGHTRLEIIKKYGEFDRLIEREYKTAKYAGLYYIAEKIDFWGPNVNIYYWILFSEDDIAVDTEIRIPLDEQ